MKIHETIPKKNRTKYKLKTLYEGNFHQKKNNDERGENTIIKKSSAPKLHDNSRVDGSNGDVSNTKHIRRWHSSSQINQSNNHWKTNNLCREQPRDSSDIRTIYDYYQYNLRRDEVLYKFSSTVDRYGFVELEDNKSKVISAQRRKLERRDEKKDAKRSVKWANWVSQSKYVIHSGKFGSSSFVFPWGSKFIDRVSKGIPDAWINPVWYFLVSKRGGETDDKLINTYKVRMLISLLKKNDFNLFNLSLLFLVIIKIIINA